MTHGLVPTRRLLLRADHCVLHAPGLLLRGTVRAAETSDPVPHLFLVLNRSPAELVIPTVRKIGHTPLRLLFQVRRLI